MLLLAHHERETIILETSDGPIEVRLSRLDGDQPRIGIDAPKSVRIIRKQINGDSDHQAVPPAHDPEEDAWWHHPDELAAVPAPGAQVQETVADDWDDMLD